MTRATPTAGTGRTDRICRPWAPSAAVGVMTSPARFSRFARPQDVAAALALTGDNYTCARRAARTSTICWATWAVPRASVRSCLVAEQGITPADSGDQPAVVATRHLVGDDSTYVSARGD